MTDFQGEIYKRSVVLLQVVTEEGMQTAGLGMLADDDRVVTCAHVVNAALRRNKRQQAPPADSAIVQLKFPNLEGKPVCPAKVVGWIPPPQSGVGSGDIAVLKLTEQAPKDSVQGVLSPTGRRIHTQLRVYGYPPPRPTGTWVDLELKGSVEGGLLQVESRHGQTFKVQPGFSGSPVWDDDNNQAVGLLHATPLAEDHERDAYIVPASDVLALLNTRSPTTAFDSAQMAELLQLLRAQSLPKANEEPSMVDEEEYRPVAVPRARRATDGIRRWAMMAGARELWQVVPGDVGPELRPIASETDADISWLRRVPGSLALSSDARVVGQLSHGLLSLAWVDRIAPRLDRWPRPFELQLVGDDARLLAVSVDFGDDVICLISTDQATYRAEASPNSNPVTTRIADSASRCAVILAGTPIVIDHEGHPRGRDLDLRQHGFAEVTSFDAARSAGQAAFAVAGLDADGQHCIAESCSTGVLTVLPGVAADHVFVIRQLSAARAPSVALLMNDGHLTRIPRGDCE